MKFIISGVNLWQHSRPRILKADMNISPVLGRTFKDMYAVCKACQSSVRFVGLELRFSIPFSGRSVW
jgi:hypothetical protein